MVKTKYINTYTSKQYTICHPVIFAMVMRDPNICKEFLQRVISERKISQVRFHSETDDDVFVEMPACRKRYIRSNWHS